MPRTGVTREQVFEAADALAAEGIQPTAKRVRDRTGGSFSTLTPHLAAWKDERGGQGVANIPDMPESIAGAARAMWAAAWNAAQEAVKTERDGLTAARREMDKERAEMAAEIVDLETKLDARKRNGSPSRQPSKRKRSVTAKPRKRWATSGSRMPGSRSASRTHSGAPTSCATRSPAWRLRSRTSRNRQVRPREHPHPSSRPSPKTRPIRQQAASHTTAARTGCRHDPRPSWCPGNGQ